MLVIFLTAQAMLWWSNLSLELLFLSAFLMSIVFFLGMEENLIFHQPQTIRRIYGKYSWLEYQSVPPSRERYFNLRKIGETWHFFFYLIAIALMGELNKWIIAGIFIVGNIGDMVMYEVIERLKKKFDAEKEKGSA